MDKRVTLILILHNRHANLDRLLKYYQGACFSILVADSSSDPHDTSSPSLSSVRYSYTPGLTYTKKIEHVLKMVDTPYVALCADDDFILPEAIISCANFLDINPAYAAAQGKILRYFFNKTHGNLRFEVLYNGDHTICAEDPAFRLQRLFTPYKSLLYAVHRTGILKSAFEGAGESFRNLYLNEYLVSLFATLSGCTADLAFLYQVREFAEGSDDKITDNLDTIMHEKRYASEFDSFVNHILYRAETSSLPGTEHIKEELIKALSGYAAQIEGFRAKQKISGEKRVGLLINHLPLIGKWVIEKRRLSISGRRLREQLDQHEMSKLKPIELALKNQ